MQRGDRSIHICVIHRRNHVSVCALHQVPLQQTRFNAPRSEDRPKQFRRVPHAAPVLMIELELSSHACAKTMHLHKCVLHMHASMHLHGCKHN